MSYEDKQEERRARYEARAEKARSEAESAYAQQKRIGDHIPMGQPILVGHHSEKRHRRDIERINNGMRKTTEALDRAKHYEAKAAGVGTGGISSDDPEAAAKLQAKIDRLEEKRAAFKAHNKQARKAGTETLPSYSLTSLSAEIRRLKKRIQYETAAAARVEAEPIVGEGFCIEECKVDNRIRFYFDTRPDKDTCKKMKRAGFRWSPTAGAWQRQLNNGGIHAAKCMARELFGWEEIK